MTVSEIYPLLEQLKRKNKLRVVQFLVNELAREEGVSEVAGWPPGFFRETFGAFRDEPLVREPQGTYEVRDELE